MTSQRAEPTEGEERDVSDPFAGESVDERVVPSVGQVVHVLHRHDRRDRLRFLHLLCGGVAHAEVTDQSLSLQVDQGLEGSRDRLGNRSVRITQAEMDEVEDVDTERLEIVVDLRLELIGLPRCRPAALRVTASARLRRDEQFRGIRVQGLADEFVDDAGPIGLRGVDVGDADAGRFAEDGESRVMVFRRADHPWAGELHGAVAETGDRAVAQGPGAAGEFQGGRVHRCAFR